MSNLRVMRRKLKVKPGHRVVMLPLASLYQEAQPPFSHTLLRSACWMPLLYSSCAGGLHVDAGQALSRTCLR